MSRMHASGWVAAPLASLALALLAGSTGAQEPLFQTIYNVDQAMLDWEKSQTDYDPTISGTRFVTVNRDLLQSMVAEPLGTQRTVSLDLFGSTHDVVLQRYGMQLQYHIFHGSLPDHDGETIVIAFGPEATAAVIEFDEERYALGYTGVENVHGLMLHDLYATHAAVGHAPCGTDDAQLAQAEPLGDLEPAVESGNLDGGVITVDVATFYTPASRQGAGGAASLESTIAARIGTANVGNNQSGPNNLGTGHQYRLVFMAETNYTETGNTTDVNRFRNNGDGFMDEVHALRDQWGADLMTLITNFSGSFCGVAYSIMCTESPTFRVNSFSVTVRSCLSQHTLTHEMGHTEGCAHDRANAGCGCFAYSYGGRNASNTIRSIMSYSPGTRVNYWSNSLRNGEIIGNASNDNTATHENASDTVASFKPTVVGSTPPTLTSISQNSAPNYSPFPTQVTLTGTNLDAVGTLTIGPGTVPINSQSFSSLSFLVPNGYTVGTHQVTVANGAGTSNALNFTIDPTSPPVLTADAIVTQGTPFNIDCWGTPGEVYHLFFSTSGMPSVLPGIVSLEIGNQFASFFLFTVLAADAGGNANLNLTFPVGTLPPLTSLWFEAIATQGPPVAPLTTTNARSILFF